MNEASQKRSLSEEEKLRLLSFFEILIKIDQRARITPTAKAKTKKRTAYGA
jgi:hypothetical protein